MRVNKKTKRNNDTNFVKLWKAFRDKILPLMGGAGDTIRKEMRYNWGGVTRDLEIKDAIKELEKRYQRLKRKGNSTGSTGAR